MASNNTNYPPFSFLPQQWNHCSRRNFFLDYGSRGSIYINEDGETLVQKTHEGSRMRPLSAQFPSLPLFEKPKYGISDVDHVGRNILKEQKEKIKLLIKRMKELNTIFKRKKCDPDAVSCLLKSVCNYENGDCSAETVFQQFHETTSLKKLYKKYSKMVDIVSIPQTNITFTGGCLQMIKFPDDSSPTDENGSMCMTAVSGLDLNKIKIFKADLEISGLLTVDETKSRKVQCSQPLLELSNQCIYDQSLCAARSRNSFLIHKILPEYFQFQTSKVDEIEFDDETLTSIFMSPYIEAECLIATSTGSVYLWNVDRRHDLVYRQSELIDPQSSWSDVHYGSHPRSLVLTTHKTMDLIDLRTSAKKTTSLFSLPSRHLNIKERLQVSKYSTSNSFQHFLAADYALFLLDERFPTYPVLQWQHMLKSVPQYMCLVPEVVQSPLDDILLIGSQYPSELMAIQYRKPENEPPIAVCSPWRISKTLDFFYMDNMHYKVEDELIKKRLTTPCLGIAGQSLNPEGMLVFQLNSLGDIFFQKYNQSTTFQDKTCSAGPGDQVVSLPIEARCRGRYWMEHLREYVQEDYFCEKEHQNVTALIKSLSVPPDSHILCRLCMPQCDNEDIESDEDIMADSCMTCCATLRESKWMVDGIESDKVIKSTDISIGKGIPSIENIPKSSCTLTKTLFKLWNDEELSGDEEEEEEEVEEKKAESEGEEEKEEEVNKENEGVEEEEEEKEDEEEINEEDLLKKSTLNFVDWGGCKSEESELATNILPNEYNIPETLDEPDSPFMFGPTQSQTVVNTIPESVPMFWELSQRQESFSSSPPERASADSTNRNLPSSGISFINKSSLEQKEDQLASSFFINDSYTPSQARSAVVSSPRYTPSQRSLYFDDISITQSTQENFLGFLSTAISQSQIENSQESRLGKLVAYEDGFGTITASQNTKPSCLLSNFSSADKMSLKTPPRKRNFEEGF